MARGFHVLLRGGSWQSEESHVLAHAFILSTAEAEAGGWLSSRSADLHSKILPPSNKSDDQ